MTIEKSDTDLISGLKSEESWAFKLLYEKYFGLVENYVKRNNGTLDDSKDTFQDTVIALMKMLAKNDFQLNQNTKLSTLIYAIAKRLWLLKLRNQKLNVVGADISDIQYQFSDDEEELMEKKEKEEIHESVIEKLKSMGQECQKLLKLYYFKKVKLKEIAKIMTYSEGFVRVKKNRCMNQLKDLM